MSKKPNIIFAFADQLRYDALACCGNRTVRTPNFDRMADEGLSFDQAFSSCPICSPYRGQVLTGRYSHANGVIDNEYALNPGQAVIGNVLRENGYRTGYVGKLHLGHGPYDQEKRDLFGFDDMYAHNCDHQCYQERLWHNEEGPFDLPGYGPRGETRICLDWIARQRREHPGKPFCAMLGWGPPHWSWGVARTSPGPNVHLHYSDYPDEFDIYDPERIDLPANIPPQYEAFARREFADYYGMVSSLDECMKRILDALGEWGIAEDTIVCLSSDHGDHLGAHGMGKPDDDWLPPHMRFSKATPWDESIHIPFLMRYPARVKGGLRSRTFFNSVDVMPTLLGLCGIEIPEGLQGTDLSHAALGLPGEEPDSVYLQILGPGWPNRSKFVGLWRGVRTDRYTYARWHDRGGMRVLYDRKMDPLEMVNLVDDPLYDDVAEDMEERLRGWIARTNDPFDSGKRLPDTDMLDVGQKLTSKEAYEILPPGYRAAIEPKGPDLDA